MAQLRSLCVLRPSHSVRDFPVFPDWLCHAYNKESTHHALQRDSVHVQRDVRNKNGKYRQRDYVEKAWSSDDSRHNVYKFVTRGELAWSHYF